MWKRLYRRLVTETGRDIIRPPERKIDAALRGAEAILGVRLPTQYKGFIRQFGPGTLADEFCILAPVVPGSGCSRYDLVGRQSEVRHPKTSYWGQKGKPGLVARLICFCGTIGGLIIFWDPADVCNRRTWDYGIYFLPRNDQNAAVRELAGSFREFVEFVCLGRGFDRLGGYEDGSLPKQQFQTAWPARQLRSVSERKHAERVAAADRPRGGG